MHLWHDFVLPIKNFSIYKTHAFASIMCINKKLIIPLPITSMMIANTHNELEVAHKGPWTIENEAIMR